MTDFQFYLLLATVVVALVGATTIAVKQNKTIQDLAVYLHKSFPEFVQGAVTELIEAGSEDALIRLEKRAAETPDKWDDETVAFIRRNRDKFLQILNEEDPTPAPSDSFKVEAAG